MTKKHLSHYFEKVIFIFVLLIIWWVVAELEIFNILLLPSPEKIFETLLKKIGDLSLFYELSISIGRVLKGYFLATFLGISLGILIGLSEHIYRLTELVIHILRPIPPIAWIPLVILWMGIGESSKIFLIFLGGFFVILVNVIDGIRYVDKKLLEVATAVETPKGKYVFQLIIPAALPNIFTGMRVALGSCWSCVVAAELVAASSGIGYMISNARNFGRMDIVIIGMISIRITGKAMDAILKYIEQKVLMWNT